MIEVKGLCKYFNGKPAVDQVSFQVEEGHTLVLLGTSGSGKTTTLKMINRLIEPDAGQIIINGTDIRQHRVEEIRRQIGYVIQHIGLFPHYTIEQNIALVPELLKWPRSRITERNQELMKLIGLPAALGKRYPHELSGGQQQRVGVARALAADPPLILMDEPFGALDPITKRQIQQEFSQLEAIRKKTMMMVTHDIFEAVILGNKIALMDNGRIQQIGSPKELIFSPANDFVKRFFDTQRFRLELQVIKVEDIVTVLDKTDFTDSNHMYIEAEMDASILQILEDMESEGVEYVKLPVKRNFSIIINRDQLFRYFYQVKANLKKL